MEPVRTQISNRMGTSLSILRRELESMQKQDKNLYMTLLTLQEQMQGLKVELKKEREKCEQAFRDLQDSPLGSQETEKRRDNSMQERGTTERKLTDNKYKDEHIKERSWKHNRQDSGISVKPFDGIIVGEATNYGIPCKPGIIHHSKQDSGILIDEEAVAETKLLSKLVQSSSGSCFKDEDRKLQSLQNRWQQVDGNSFGILSNKKHHTRSITRSDLYRNTRERCQRDRTANSLTPPKHSRTASCPSTLANRLSQEDRGSKVVPHRHTRPSRRSASIVNLNSLDETKNKEVVERFVVASGGQHSKVRSKSEPVLRVVFVSASEVTVPNANGLPRSYASRQLSLDGGMQGSTRLFKAQRAQRRFSVGGMKLVKPYRDTRPDKPVDSRNGMTEKHIKSLSSSFQFLRKHAHHSSVPENDVTKRRHSMNVRHVCSKSWDGNVEKPREQSGLLKSRSQVSLV